MPWDDFGIPLVHNGDCSAQMQAMHEDNFIILVRVDLLNLVLRRWIIRIR
jgi:hypothetical protein